MADGVVLNAGSGGVTAVTDDCGAAGHAQVVKLAIATDGSATLIPADGTNGLLVNVVDRAARDNGIVDIGAALPAGTNNIGDVDVLTIAAGDNNIGNVDIVTVPAPLSTTGGGTEATALRVTIASDSTGVVSIDDNGGAITVDGTVAVSGAVDTELTTADLDTGAGTDTRAVVGLVLAASGGGLLVGAANPMPISDNAGAISVDDNAGSLTVDNAALSVVGGGVEASALRVTIASDSTGVLSVDDNGGALTVDNGGTFAVQAASAGDVAHDSADSGNPVKFGAKAETAPSAVTAVADGDRSNLYCGADGILYVRPYCALEDIVSGVDTDTAGDSTSVIAAPGAGIRLYVTSVIVKNTHATTDAYVDIRDGAAGTVLASIPAPAAGGAVVSFPVPLRLTANTACCVDPSAAVSTIITTVVGFKAAV